MKAARSVESPCIRALAVALLGKSLTSSLQRGGHTKHFADTARGTGGQAEDLAAVTGQATGAVDLILRIGSDRRVRTRFRVSYPGAVR